MKLWIPTVILALAAILPLQAQSNEVLDTVLERDALRFGEAAYLVLVGSGRLSDTASLEEAAQTVAKAFPRVPSRAADEWIPLGEYAYLLMQAFEVKGGLMYRLIPGPRYAARELAYRKMIRGKAHPGLPVEGAQAVQILRRLLEWKETLS
jgi:hypothetical protein